MQHVTSFKCRLFMRHRPRNGKVVACAYTGHRCQRADVNLSLQRLFPAFYHVLLLAHHNQWSLPHYDTPLQRRLAPLSQRDLKVSFRGELGCGGSPDLCLPSWGCLELGLCPTCVSYEWIWSWKSHYSLGEVGLTMWALILLNNKIGIN